MRSIGFAAALLYLAGCGASGPIGPPPAPKPPGLPIFVGSTFGPGLIEMRKPAYPRWLRTGAPQTVALRCQVDEGGAVSVLNVVSGPAALVPYAVEAAGKWRYEPFCLFDPNTGKCYPHPVIIHIQMTF